MAQNKRVTDDDLAGLTVILRLIATESKPLVTLYPETAELALRAVEELREIRARADKN